jgi:hypothetical protein
MRDVQKRVALRPSKMRPHQLVASNPLIGHSSAFHLCLLISNF